MYRYCYRKLRELIFLRPDFYFAIVVQYDFTAQIKPHTGSFRCCLCREEWGENLFQDSGFDADAVVAQLYPQKLPLLSQFYFQQSVKCLLFLLLLERIDAVLQDAHNDFSQQ